MLSSDWWSDRNIVSRRLHFQFHVLVGPTTLAVGGAFWIWIVMRRSEATLTAMAVIGTSFAQSGLPMARAGLVPHVHKLIADPIWTYLIGHAGLAMLNQRVGVPILRRSFGRGAP